MAVLLYCLLFSVNTSTSSLPILLLPCVIVIICLAVNFSQHEKNPILLKYRLRNSTPLCSSESSVDLQVDFHRDFMGTFPKRSEPPILITCPKALECRRFSNSCKMTCYNFLNSLLEIIGPFKRKFKNVIIGRLQDWMYSCLKTSDLAIEERII